MVLRSSVLVQPQFDFQVGTGRMPMQMQGTQAQVKPGQFNEEQTKQLSAYVASLGAGPAIPEAENLDTTKGDAAMVPVSS